MAAETQKKASETPKESKTEKKSAADLKEDARKRAEANKETARKFAEQRRKAGQAKKEQQAGEAKGEEARGGEQQAGEQQAQGERAAEGEEAQGGEQPADEAAEILRRATEAWQRIAQKETFEDWVDVALQIQSDTTTALNQSQQNAPVGDKFFRPYRRLEEQRPWRDIDKSDRSYCRQLAADLQRIRAWRNGEPETRRFKLNHPAWVVREYRAAHPETKRPRVAPATPRPTIQSLKRDLDAANAHAAELQTALEQERQNRPNANALVDDAYVQQVVQMLGGVARAKQVAQLISNLPNE